MDVITQWRLLSGAALPFLPGKVRDAFSRRRAIRKALRRIPTSAEGIGTPRMGLLPMPAPEWLQESLEDAAAFARRVQRGDIRAYGVTEYRLDQLEPESFDARGVLEIARMHQWPAYALAAKRAERNGDPDDALKWYRSFMTEVSLFTRVHKPAESPLWAVAMDNAIRVVNLLVAYDWFQQLGIADPADGPVLSAVACDHALMIDAALETAGGMGTSHLLADLMGLVVVDCYAGRHPERLPDYAQQVLKQILEDGLSFEASTGYHRQVADILVVAQVVLARSGVDLPDPLVERVNKAVQALTILEQHGMPLIGDNDDGMVLKLTGFVPDTSLLHALHPTTSMDSPLQHFPDFGLTLYAKERYSVSARCGPIGQYGKGGHAHNDQNSITWRVDGVAMIVDPGSTWYAGDPQQRNRDRSVRAHATMRLNQGEQHEIPSGGGSALWWMVPRVETTIVEATAAQWVGEVRYAAGTHRRTLTLHDDYLDGLDVIPEGSTGEIRFPLAPNTTATPHASSVTLSRNGVHATLTWSGPCSLRIASSDVRVAARFGLAETADVVILNMQSETCSWQLRPSP